MTITVFKDIWKKTEPNYITVDKVYDRIRSGKDSELVSAIRSAESKKDRNEIKKKLPCICFSGKFTARFDDKLTEHSGRAVLDVDGITTDIEVKKAEMASYPFVEACFVSPSGDGLKVVCRIPADIEKHRGYYRGLMKIFPQLDTTSINESRVCYSSIDPDIYVNMDAVEFTDYVDEPISQVRQYAEVEYKNVNTDYRRIDRAVKMVREAVDGEKHKKLLQASKLMGGYIAGGLVSESEGIRILEQEIQNKNIDDFPAAQKTIASGIEYGRSSPIEEDIREPIRQEGSNNKPSNAGIIPIDEAWECMKYAFKYGKKRGSTTHFAKFDENFKWKEGEITLIIARPNAGKTEFVLQLMLLKTHFDGWKWGVFSPENYPADEFYDSLIHTYIGKTTDPHYASAQMSLEEYERGYKFVREHFFYVYPENHTIEEIDKNFDYLINEVGIKGTFLDPFNQITKDHSSRDDQFLSDFLSIRKRKAIKYGLHDVISTHPKSMSRNKNGEYDIPDMYDAAGGAMWGNKMDNIMVIHRPYFFSNPMDTTVEIHVRKIKKQKLVGIPGMCVFSFQRKTNRYYIDGISPLEKEPYHEMPVGSWKPISPRISPPKEKEDEPIEIDDDPPPF